MLRMLNYLLRQGIATTPVVPMTLPTETRCLPKLTDASCACASCDICEKICPTNAISLKKTVCDVAVKIDLGACINCSLCVSNCPTGTIVSDNSVKTAQENRKDLILTSVYKTQIDQSNMVSLSQSPDMASLGQSPDTVSLEQPPSTEIRRNNLFRRSIACRVVSTGCAACDLEIAACTNPIFDMERFGISIVASPRFADVLLITGPVPKSMHHALKSCYKAMSEPRKVIAVGTCACSGGLHKDGYAEANGVNDILPVDIFVPGCPPHPWSIIDALLRVMNS